MYIIHAMNYPSSESVVSALDVTNQAALLARLTRDLSYCCQAKESEIFGQHGLSPGEGFVMLAIAEAGATTPSAVAERLRVGRSRVTPLVQQLVGRGLVARITSEEDRRLRALKLTPAGERVARDAERFRLSFHSQLLETFDAMDRHQMLSLLRLLYERMVQLRRTLNGSVRR